MQLWRRPFHHYNWNGKAIRVNIPATNIIMRAYRHISVEAADKLKLLSIFLVFIVFFNFACESKTHRKVPGCEQSRIWMGHFSSSLRACVCAKAPNLSISWRRALSKRRSRHPRLLKSFFGVAQREKDVNWPQKNDVWFGSFSCRIWR